jgi:hypothetical protein
MFAEGIGSVFDGMAGSRRLDGLAANSLGLGVQAAALGAVRELPQATWFPETTSERPLSQWSAAGLGLEGSSDGTLAGWARPLMDVYGPAGAFASTSPVYEGLTCPAAVGWLDTGPASVQGCLGESPFFEGRWDTSCLPQTPSLSRRIHELTREASPQEVDTVTQCLETAIGSFSRGTLAEFAHWMEGQDLCALTSDSYTRGGDLDRQRRSRERSMHEYLRRLRAFVQAMVAEGRYHALRRVGRDGLLNVITGLCKARKRERKRLPDPPLRVPSCAAAASELASTIMRHGPPAHRSSGKPAMSGVSVC